MAVKATMQDLEGCRSPFSSVERSGSRLSASIPFRFHRIRGVTHLKLVLTFVPRLFGEPANVIQASLAFRFFGDSYCANTRILSESFPLRVQDVFARSTVRVRPLEEVLLWETAEEFFRSIEAKRRPAGITSLGQFDSIIGALPNGTNHPLREWLVWCMPQAIGLW